MVNAKVKPAGDLYAVLGVARDADEKAIRRAYRRAAKRCHPDAQNGSEEAFQRLTEAHAVLTDEKRRADYDRTGEFHEPGPDNSDCAALGLIAGLLEQACAEDANIFSIDLRAKLVRALKKSCAELQDELQEMTRQRVQAQRLAKKFIRKNGGENLLGGMLLARAADLERFEANRQQLVAERERAVAILAEYDFMVEAPQPGAAKPSAFGAGGNMTAKEVLAILNDISGRSQRPPPGGALGGFPLGGFIIDPGT